MRENSYQSRLIKVLRQMFEGCVILKNDPGYLQGVPDLIILYEKKWAALEVKASYDSSIQPNQKYYVDLMNAMSFAAFIDPSNEEDVLYALQQTFKPHRAARIPKRV